MANFLLNLEHMITNISEIIWPIFIPFMLVLGIYVSIKTIFTIQPKLTKPSKMKFKNKECV